MTKHKKTKIHLHELEKMTGRLKKERKSSTFQLANWEQNYASLKEDNLAAKKQVKALQAEMMKQKKEFSKYYCFFST